MPTDSGGTIQGSCIPSEGGPVGFSVELTMGHYIILQIELNENQKTMECFDFIDGIISKHSLPIWGPVPITSPHAPYIGYYYEIPTGLRHLKITTMNLWSRALVKIYSPLLKAYRNKDVFEALSNFRKEIKKEELKELLNYIPRRSSSNCWCLFSLFEERFFTEKSIYKDIDSLLSNLEYIMSCLQYLEGYSVTGKAGSGIARKVVNKLRIIEEKENLLTTELLNDLKKEFRKAT